MKQVLITISSLFIILLSASAQKEIYFNTTKPEDINVNSMRGVEIGSTLITYSLFSPSYYDKSFAIPLYMGYFDEKRIAQSWTLTSRIGLSHSFGNLSHYILFKDSMQMGDSIYHYNNTRIDHYKSEYSLNLGISIEPRWYFGYKKRYQVGKANLNTGWFLSLPLTAAVTLINTYKNVIYTDSYKSYCTFGLTGVLGYRQAISKHWFLEGNCQLIKVNSEIFTRNNKISISQPWINLLPGISIKAAYTFK